MLYIQSAFFVIFVQAGNAGQWGKIHEGPIFTSGFWRSLSMLWETSESRAANENQQAAVFSDVRVDVCREKTSGLEYRSEP